MSEKYRKIKVNNTDSSHAPNGQDYFQIGIGGRAIVPVELISAQGLELNNWDEETPFLGIEDDGGKTE